MDAEIDTLGSHLADDLACFDRDGRPSIWDAPALGTAFQLAGYFQNLRVQTGQVDKDGGYFAGAPDDNPIVFQDTRIALGSRPEGGKSLSER